MCQKIGYRSPIVNCQKSLRPLHAELNDLLLSSIMAKSMNKNIYRAALVLVSIFYSTFLIADVKIKELENQRPNRILFVGNSYLYYNDSLHNHVRRMAEERFPERTKMTAYKSATISGSRLSHHNLDHLLDSKNIGLKKNFELVILQGGSSEPLSEDGRHAFYRQVEEKVEMIRAKEGEAALYMTHAYAEPHKAFDPKMINHIKDTYLRAGNDNSVLVIPVGLAFAEAHEQRPDLQLHKSFDGSHPSLLGTYLASCVVFASIFNSSPIGLDYNYFNSVSDADKVFLQGIANQTIANFYTKQD